MTGHLNQPPRITGTTTVTTVFLRPSFRITTRDGSLDVAVKAAPAGALTTEGGAESPLGADLPANDDGKDATDWRRTSRLHARA